MKKIVIILSSLLFSLSFYAHGSDSTDVIITRGFQKVDKSLNILPGETAKLIKAQTHTVPSKRENVVNSVLSFLPVIFFLLIMLVITNKMRTDGISLREILLDKEQQLAIKKEETKVQIAETKVREALVKSAPGNPQTLTDLNKISPLAEDSAEASQSTSRFIAFVTGLVSLSLAVCMTSFYFYRWSLGDTEIDFKNLSAVLYGLGIGILPYGFTKVASLFK